MRVVSKPVSSIETQGWRPQPRLAHCVSTGDQLDRLNSGGGIAVDFSPLRDRPIHIAFAGSQSETLSVWTTETQTGFRTSPKLDAELVTVRFVESGAMSRVERAGSNVIVGFNEALFTSFDDMRYEEATPGFSAITASVSRSSVVAACQAMGGRGAATLPQHSSSVSLNTVALSALRQTVALLRHQLLIERELTDLMTPLLQELLIFQIVAAWPTVGGALEQSIGQTTDRPVKLAVDFIEGNLGRDIRIVEIAKASGLGVRSLQTAFKRRMGCSPVQYLISRRLDQVHEALRTEDCGTIRRVAQHWGFVHMSDFAQRYRARFGHSPRRSRDLRN